MKLNNQSLESLLGSLGGRGKFQIMVHMLAAYTYIVLVFNHVIMAFHGTPIAHNCMYYQGTDATLDKIIPGTWPYKNSSQKVLVNATHAECNATLFYSDGQSETVQCTSRGQWRYKPVYDEKNIVSQFDLVCSDAYLANLATTLYFAGVMVGGVVFGDLADRFGRLPIMLFTLYSSTILGIIIAFSVNYVMFVVLRFINGILMQGLQTSAYTLIMELYVAKHRPFAGAVTECFFGSSIMLLAGLAFAVRDWQHLQILISLFGVLAVFYPWVVPESLRWLIMKGKTDRADLVIKNICKMNKVPYPAEQWEALREDTDKQMKDGGSQSVYNFTDMFRTGHMRKRSVILFYIWLVISTCYYGLTFKMSGFKGNRYLNFFIGGAVETLAYAVSLPIMRKFGRKKPLLACFLIAAATCLAAGFINDYTAGLSHVTITLAITGRCAMACLFAIIFVYTSEIYPTVIRNIGMGACCFWARVGGVLAPQINQWTKTLWDVDAIIIFGVMSLLAGLVLFPLPETHNKRLPDSLREVEVSSASSSENNLPDFKEKITADGVKREEIPMQGVA
ncbi:unnamed protein product [Lymnaea stagnalis]|uniref:Major facilitator superfamily (MFS) profile domain-containing protein n=1 Tax=Lymnaea stagnalis TaxID=6523 RepID=A0AAV2HU69_LYMST